MLDFSVDEEALAARRAEADAARAFGKDGPQRIDIDIAGPINSGTLDLVEAKLAAAPFADEIHVMVDSGGGEWRYAFDSYALIVAHPARTKTSTIRRAKSAAITVAMACDVRRAAIGAEVLLHPASLTPECGRWTATRHRDAAAFLEALDRTEANLLAYRTGKSPEVFWQEIQTETPAKFRWLVDNRIINRIIDGTSESIR